MVSYISCSGLK